METLVYSVTLVRVICGECSVPFAISETLYEKAQQRGQQFWCPNGHKIGYNETENDRLKAKLEREEHWRRDAETRATAARDQAQAAERRVTAYKGVVTRVKKRAAAGMCPAPGCRRHFADLQRHMESKHPGFAESPDLA